MFFFSEMTVITICWRTAAKTRQQNQGVDGVIKTKHSWQEKEDENGYMTAEHEAKINHVLDMKSAQEKIMDRQEAKLSYSSWISMYWHSYWIFLMVRYDSIEDIL
jgi:hypothetical protein